MVVPTITQNPSAMILPFLYLGTGYLSLLLGYRLSGDTNVFFNKLKGTDTIIMTFVIGSYSILAARPFLGDFTGMNSSALPLFVIYLGILTVINGIVIKLIREKLGD